MPRILFVKTSSLGDVIHHCPAVSDAARNVRGIEIDWLVEDAFAAIPHMHPQVRRTIPVGLRRWRGALWQRAAWKEMRALRATLRAERYDAVIDTQGLLKSAALAAFAIGPKHGMDRASAREPLAALFYAQRHAVAREQHAVERNRRLTAAALGYAAGGPCDYGLRAVQGEPLFADQPNVVLLTMTSRNDKRWPDAHWVRAAQQIAARGIRPILPWGTQEERARCEGIASNVPSAIVPPRMSLEEIGALLRGARAALGVDTGLTHLAVALGKPAVGIYCASNAARTGLYGSPSARNVGGVGQVPSPDVVLSMLSEYL